MNDALSRLLACLDRGLPAVYCAVVETPRLDAAEGRGRHARLPRRHARPARSAAAASRRRSSGGHCAACRRRTARGPHLQPRRRLRLGRRPHLRRPDDHPRRPARRPAPATAGRDYYRRCATWPRRGDGFTEAVVVGDGRRACPSATATCSTRPAAGRGPARRRPVRGDGRRATCRPAGQRPRPAAPRRASPTCRRCRASRCSSSAAGTSGRRSPGWRPRSDFDVWVLDDRERFASRERFPTAERLLVGDIGATLRRPRPDADGRDLLPSS